jgi:alpha-L-arabinofuranosidase
MLAAACVLLEMSTARAQLSATLDVDVAESGAALPPHFFGLMTEEINHSYDGGLHAELIQNRTFQDPRPQRSGRGGGGGARDRDRRDENRVPIHWSLIGSGNISTDDSDPVNAALPISLKLELAGSEGGIANDGYWGIPIRPDTMYTATFYAKGGEGFVGRVTASLRLDDGDAIVAKADTEPITSGWHKYTLTIRTPRDAPTTANARFALSASGTGSVLFSYVSLFPPTYEDAPNGLRPDLMKLLADLQPKFIRFPGGNYVEGSRFSDRFNWKQMIGPPDQRPGHMGCWSYRSSDGMGLPEFLLWCKQLGAEPVLGVFAGYVLNGDHFKAGSPEMAIYTEEALQEIEYIIGPADSEWGKKRAADGFPEPFPLRYVEIGNEDWFDRSGSYDGRFAQMARAIRERYPHLKIIASAPVNSAKPDLYDDHFYRSPRVLRQMFSHYDMPIGPPPQLKFEGGGWSGRRLDGIKTFVGEWAAHEGRPTTNLNAALSDAAFVMGLERNSDVVEMQCYAPLLANVNPANPNKGYPRGWQWEYNLIGYDALGSYGSPSYHAQVMLVQNRGDVALDTKLNLQSVPLPASDTPRGKIGVASWHTRVEYKDISVTGPDGRTLLAADLAKKSDAWVSTGGQWRVEDNLIKPADADAETWAIIGDANWTDYTIRLKARKLGGREGFIVLFHAADGDNYQWWNIGGWENTVTRTEAAENGARQPYGPETDVTVETGRWYELRLEVSGHRLRGYIDGSLVTDVTYEPPPNSTPIYASATYDKASRTVFVKIVNAGDAPVDTAVNVRGVAGVEPNGTAIVLTGNPGDVNSVSEPRKVAPHEESIPDASTSFHRTFPAHSFTILRLKTAPQ